MTLTRRELLRAAGASLALGPAGCSIFGLGAPEKDLISRQENPFNAEPRLDRLLESWTTPYEHFYVRCHGTQPVVDPATYALTVEGLVERTLRLSLEDLQKLPKVSVSATLQCAGSRRNEHNHVKPVAGVLWDAGAISTAEWRGLRLSVLLERAGLKPAAKQLWFDGLDTVTLKDRQTVFGGGVPLEKAMRPETIVALEMNGSPLSREHGFPARTIVPGFIGARSVKWLGRIVVADRPSENNFVARDYKLFPPEAAAETVKPAEFEPIYENILTSALCRPLAGQTLKAGRTQAAGYALPPGSPGGAIGGVEVSPDGGATWVPATLTGKDQPFSWRLWTADLDLTPGARTLVVRAKDAAGALQPERAPWNFKGYFYNGWHRVPVTVA
ncbi:MAG: molybdopterin-dependent oxidoreductase [Planctomycetes bacterium]|nr:molybdopterin-dependent oxidoreductase [Planctomycetota bacterium]